MRENTGTIDFMQTFTKSDPKSPSPMAALTEPDVINSCQSELNSENWKLKRMIGAQGLGAVEFCSEPAGTEVLR